MNKAMTNKNFIKKTIITKNYDKDTWVNNSSNIIWANHKNILLTLGEKRLK